METGVREQREYWKTLCEELLLPYERATYVEHRKQLIHIANGSLLVFSLVNILWFIVEFGFLRVSPLGFASLTVFTAILIMQFIAMFYHRLMTASHELSRATFLPRMSKVRRPWELSSLPGMTFTGHDHGHNISNISA